MLERCKRFPADDAEDARGRRMARHAGRDARLRDAARRVVDSHVLVGERDDGVDGALRGVLLRLLLFVFFRGRLVGAMVVRRGPAAALHRSAFIALLRLVAENVAEAVLGGCWGGRSEQAGGDESGDKATAEGRDQPRRCASILVGAHDPLSSRISLFRNAILYSAGVEFVRGRSAGVALIRLGCCFGVSLRSQSH